MRRSAFVALLMVAVVLAGLGASIYVVARSPEAARLSQLSFSFGVAMFTLIGAVIVWRQPANRIGWIFASIGILWVTGDLAGRYSTYAFLTGRGKGTLAFLGAWYGEWYWFLFLILTFSLLPQLFPTGRPMRGRWTGFAKAVFLFMTVVAVVTMLEDDLVLVGTDAIIDNPFGIPGFADVEEGVTAAPVFSGGLLCIAGGAAAVIHRFRRSRGDERQQLKWFTLAVLALVLQFVVQSLFGDDSGHPYPLLDGIALALVPISAAVAILRYRLYDIDLVINRALVYGLLTAILAGAYLGIVVLLQALLQPVTAESDIAVAGSTLAVAALFRPLRSRVQGFIDRRFYRGKYDAAETLERFSVRLRDEVDLNSLSHDLMEVVGSTMQPAHASLWLRTATNAEGHRA